HQPYPKSCCQLCVLNHTAVPTHRSNRGRVSMVRSAMLISERRVNPPPLSPTLVQDNVPAQVIDRVWIGSIHAAFNQESMQERGITHVLNASGLPNTFPRLFTYFTVDVRDKENANILSAIGAVNIFIEAGVEKGGVLVHCAAGKSRSAAFVVGFLLSTLGWPYEQAYAKVRRARPVASINRGFEQQLRAYSASHCDVFASHQMMLRIRAGRLLDRRRSLLARLQLMGGGSGSGDTGEGGGGGGGGAGGAGAGRDKRGVMMGVSTTESCTGSLLSIPTPRSPRGRRSPGGGGSTARRPSIHEAGAGGGTAACGGEAVAGEASSLHESTPGTTTTEVVGLGESGQRRAESLSYLPMEPRPVRFRLCRPGSASVQVIPPLRALERIYACQRCGAFLLTGGHIIKVSV
ncbi:unnamed protein product, partial [Discosporangium mesarthrocarpum]